MKPISLLIAAAFLAISADHAIAATIVNPSTELSARKRQKLSPVGGEMAHAHLIYNGRSASDQITMPTMSASLEKRSSSNPRVPMLKEIEELMKKLDLRIQSVEHASHDPSARRREVNAFIKGSVKALKIISEALKDNLSTKNDGEIDELTRSQWKMSIAGCSGEMISSYKGRLTDDQLLGELNIYDEKKRLMSEANLLSFVLDFKTVEKGLEPYRVLLYQWKAAQLLQDLLRFYGAVKEHGDHSFLLAYDKMATEIFQGIQSSKAIDQNPLENEPFLFKHMPFRLESRPDEHKVRHGVKEFRIFFGSLLQDVGASISIGRKLRLMDGVLKSYTEGAPDTKGAPTLAYQITGIAKRFLYYFLDPLDGVSREDTFRLCQSFVDRMWVASAHINKANGRISLPSQLQGPPTDAALRSTEGWYAEVSRIQTETKELEGSEELEKWRKNEDVIVTSKKVKKDKELMKLLESVKSTPFSKPNYPVDGKLLLIFRLEHVKKDIARAKRFQREALGEEHKSQAIDRLWRDLTAGKNYADQGDDTMIQWLQISPEMQRKISSMDFRGGIAKKILKRLIKKEKAQDLMNYEPLALAIDEYPNMINTIYANDKLDYLASWTLYKLEKIKSGTKDATAKGSIIQRLLPLRKLHAAITEKAMTDPDIRTRERPRHLMSLVGLHSVLANGLYEMFLHLGFNGRKSEKAFLMLLEGKEVQGLIAHKIIRGLMAKKTLESPTDHQVSQKDITERRLQAVAAEEVLQGILHNRAHHELIADKTLRDLVRYAKFRELVNDQKFLRDFDKSFNLGEIERNIQKIPLDRDESKKFKRLEPKLRNLLNAP